MSISTQEKAKRGGLLGFTARGPAFWAAWAVFILVPLVLIPAFYSNGTINSYYYDVLMRTGIAIVMAVSLNIVNGHLGQFSIGHAGFMGLGAYVSGVLMAGGNPGKAGLALRVPGLFSTLPVLNVFGYEFSVGFILATLAGGVVAAMLAFVVGIPSFRARGDYLAVVTLALNMIIVNVFLNLDFVGGARGLTGLPSFSNFIFVWLAVIAVIIVSRNLITSSHGRAILAVRENEVAAEIGGVNILRYKLIGFAIGAFFAGVGGALLGFHVQFINPPMFNVFKSFDFMIMIYLGGVGSITGTALGAVIWTILQEALRPIGVWRLVLGPVLLVIIMIFWTKGLLQSELPFIIQKKRKG